MSPELVALIERYRHEVETLPEREKATLEDGIWTMVLNEKIREGMNQTGWFKHKLGALSSNVGYRHDLFAAGPLADGLWERIARKEMAPVTAVNLLREAKVISFKQKKEMSVALSDAMTRYDRLPCVVKTPNGYWLRKARPGKAKKPPKAGRRLYYSSLVPDPESDMDFWKSIRKQISEFFSSKIKHRVFSDTLARDFNHELSGLVHKYRSRMKRTESVDKVLSAHEDEAKKQVEWACSLLHVDPPAPREKIDLKRAQHYRDSIVYASHPDATLGSSEEMDARRELFQDVVKAYKVLRHYNHKLDHPVEEDQAAQPHAEVGNAHEQHSRSSSHAPGAKEG